MRLLCFILMCLVTKSSLAVGDDGADNIPAQPFDLVLQYHTNGTVDEKLIILEASSMVRIHSRGVPDNVSFAILQAHSQVHDLTLSRDENLVYGNHVKGSSTGIYTEVQGRGVSGYLFNNNPFNVTVLVFIMYYDRLAPEPGGCNLEFEMERAPWLNVSHDRAMIQVDHEAAAVPSGKSTSPCETDSLHYEVFHHYMTERDFSEESFFETIRRLRSVEGAKRFGREIRTFGFTPSTRSLFSVYPGVGRAFSVIVTYVGEPSDRYPAAAYVPSVSYGCDLSVEGDCETLNTTMGKIMCALSLFIGLFIAFAGHRYFATEMFLTGFVIFSMVSYIVLVNQYDPGVTGLASGTSAIGLLGGLLWWFVWTYWGIPAISVLPVVLMFGFLAASILFHLPISFEFLTNDLNFWSAFGCCWLVFPVFLMMLTRMGNLISCGVLGSYAVIVPIDHYIGGSLKYIVVNVIRRATVRNFGRAVLDPPFQDNDLILTLAWAGLAISGTAFQYVRERKRPPFSPPADMWRPSGLASRRQRVAERAPLITDVATPTGAHYGSV